MEPNFQLEVGACSLEELPNFRAVQLPVAGLLYRSAYADRLSERGVGQLSELVATIVDLRGRREMLRTLAGGHVTRVYRQRLLGNDGACSSCPEAPDAEESRPDRVRFTIDFLGRHFFFRTFARLPPATMLSIGCSFLASYYTGDRQYEGRAAEVALKPRGLSGQACDFVDFCQREVAAVLRLLLQPGRLPCLLHCFLGKDRTGLLALLLQWLAGVPLAVMQEEYLLSQKLTEGMRQEAVRYYAEKRLPPSFAECHTEELEAVMHHISTTYGGVEGYLLATGLSQQEVDQLKATFGGS